MGQQVTITSVTANTPVEIYYCDSMSASCVYVATVSTFPFYFDVPDPYDLTDYIIKIVDVNGCVDTDTILITPTPTSSITPTVTQTSTNTPTVTQTPTITPTNTATPTTTITTTPTNTQTPTATPVVSVHPIGQNTYTSSAITCTDVMSVNNLYCYINQANTIPVIGVKVYSNLYNGTLYTPYNGLNKWILMEWGGFFYSVQIDTSGTMIDYALCTNLITPTPTITTTPTVTPTIATTPTNTPTNTTTPTETVQVTPTNTSTPTNTQTQTVTNTPTPSTTPPTISSLFNLTLTEVGSDVVMSGSGTFDTTNLTFIFNASFQGFISAINSFLHAGTGSSNVSTDVYSGITTYPSNFGSGTQFNANTGSGDSVGVLLQGLTNYRLMVPPGYVSNTTLTAESTFTGKTFTSLGVTPGTYTWSWGTGAHIGTMILQIT